MPLKAETSFEKSTSLGWHSNMQKLHKWSVEEIHIRLFHSIHILVMDY